MIIFLSAAWCNDHDLSHKTQILANPTDVLIFFIFQPILLISFFGISTQFFPFSVFWDLYSAQPDKKDKVEATQEARTYHKMVPNFYKLKTITANLALC